MVTDDPTAQETAAPPGAAEPARRSLAELIARSPQGIEPKRVVAWACQAAAELEVLHASGSCHGSIDARSIEIGPDGTARLAGASAAGEERGLLLGAAPGAARREARGLAAAIYEALSGKPPGDDPAPIPGVTVQVNLALLAALGRDDAARPATAGQLASMLGGGPVPVSPRSRAPSAALGAITAVGCMAIAALAWWRLEEPAPGPELEVVQAPLAEDAPAGGLAEELRAVESRLRAEAARRRWQATAAQRPSALSEDLRMEAEGHAASAASAAALLDQGHHGRAQQLYEEAADGLCRVIEDDRDMRLAADPATADAAQAPADESGAARGAAPLFQQAAARMGEAALRELAGDRDLRTEPAAATGSAPVADFAPLADSAPPAASSAIIVNSLSQTLVFIVPGAFRMGCAPGPEGGDLCGPQHSVQLSRGFYLGRVEVTRGQFAAFVGAAGYLTTAERAGWALGLDESGRWQRLAGLSWRNPGFAQSDNHPVVCVSADDAEAFCLWIGGREGRRYRLPTEAEWEYACRGGSLAEWSWVDSPTAAGPGCNGADASWAVRFPGSTGFDRDDGHAFTSPVALYPANGWGLFDMHGNVQEWCQDAYAPYSAEDAVDPMGAGEGGGGARVVRGGSFASPPEGCRAAQRDAAPPEATLVTTGFRVVMEP